MHASWYFPERAAKTDMEEKKLLNKVFLQGFMALEQHESEWLMTEFEFLGELTLKSEKLLFTCIYSCHFKPIVSVSLSVQVESENQLSLIWK